VATLTGGGPVSPSRGGQPERRRATDASCSTDIRFTDREETGASYRCVAARLQKVERATACSDWSWVVAISRGPGQPCDQINPAALHKCTFRPVAILDCPPRQVYVEMGQLDDEDRPFVLARFGAPTRFS
jgi:hypothetical protein